MGMDSLDSLTRAKPHILARWPRLSADEKFRHLQERKKRNKRKVYRSSERTSLRKRLISAGPNFGFSENGIVIASSARCGHWILTHTRSLRTSRKWRRVFASFPKSILRIWRVNARSLSRKNSAVFRKQRHVLAWMPHSV